MPMETKKRILSLLLASALLAAPLTACDMADDAIDSTEETTEETTTVDPAGNESNNDQTEPTQKDTVSDLPKGGQSELRLFRSLTNASVWLDSDGEHYIYINEWAAYRRLRGISSYFFSSLNSALSIPHSAYIPYNMHYSKNCYDSIIVDDETATVVIIIQDGNWDEPIIITCHFNRTNSLVEAHAVPLNVKASGEYDSYFVNMLDANHGYYLLTANMDGWENSERCKNSPDWDPDKISMWPLFVFETTDGGKSWNQLPTIFLDDSSDCINIFKFLSPQVGIIGFRYQCLSDLCERTYLTIDGGLTWNQISQLPYPFKGHSWYSEVLDIEQIDNRYYLTVEVRGRLVAIEGEDYSFPSEDTTVELRYESKDLVNWSLIED